MPRLLTIFVGIIIFELWIIIMYMPGDPTHLRKMFGMTPPQGLSADTASSTPTRRKSCADPNPCPEGYECREGGPAVVDMCFPR